MNPQEYGYKYIGPIVLNYIMWLNSRIKDKYDVVCFMSRDGYILKAIYDYLYGTSSQLTKYFYSSRVMLYQAAVTNEKDWVYDRLLEVKEDQVFCSCLERVGLFINRETLLDNYGIDLDSVITKNNIIQFQRIISENLQVLAESALRKRSVIIEYWNQLGLINKNVALIDFGWYGTQARCIDKIVNLEALNIHFDYYFYNLLHPYHKSWEDNSLRYNSYMHNRCNNFDIFYNENDFLYVIPILDRIFSAPHPMVLELKERNGKIVPYFDVWNSREWKTVEKIHKGIIQYCISNNTNNNSEIEILNMLYTEWRKFYNVYKDLTCSSTYGSEIYNYKLIDYLERCLEP